MSAGIGDGKAAKLDGNQANGKESVVFGYRSGNSSVFPYSGVLSLVRDGDSFSLVGLSHAAGTPYPYVSTYSRLIIMDCNKDGYDDAIIYYVEVASWELNYGDVVLFLNTRRGLGSGEVFGFEEGRHRVLVDNQCISWGLFVQQLDEDLEITVCSVVRIPHWCPLILGAKYAYGMDVIDFLTQVGGS